MLLQKAVDIFNVLIDKYGSPNVINREVIDYINMGINEQLNRLFPDNQGAMLNFEFDSNTLANIQPLIYTLTGISMNSSGIVTTTVINTALQTATGDSSSKYFRVGSIGMINGSTTYPVKFVKQNNRWAYQRNVFKSPSVTNPRFTLLATGLQIFPTDTTKLLTINVVKNPKVLTDSDLATECEFNDYGMYNVIAIAVKLAGVGIRDEQLIEDVRMTGVQITQ